MNNEFVNKSIVDGLISTSIHSQYKVFGRIGNREFSTISAISGDMGNRVNVKVSYREANDRLTIGFNLAYGAPVASYDNVVAFFDGIRRFYKGNYSAFLKEFSSLCGVILSSLPDGLAKDDYFKLGVAFAWAYSSPDMVKKGWFLNELSDIIILSYTDHHVAGYSLMDLWVTMTEKGVYQDVIDKGLAKIGSAFSNHSSVKRHEIMRKSIESFCLIGEAYAKLINKFGVDHLSDSLRNQVASRYLQIETFVLMDLYNTSPREIDYLNVALSICSIDQHSSEEKFDAIRSCR